MAQLRQDYDRIAANLKLVVITPHPVAVTATYQAEHHLTYPILSDRRRKAYRLYGLGRLSVLHEINPLTWLRNLPSLRKQGVARSTDADMAQLGGVFVIDNLGILRYVHIAHDASDNPPTAEILAASKKLLPAG